ncbi:hypothetical protein GGS23DRAFT_585769 [Durotheca rogersii]|uniref:uncharacterized protein n=1 Tax=Durotheca rogersii TaxID=419775 RepID=UPI00221E8465|nr:uncharacterized protein GGS23DRAFT_585769 [Durotheca rogersii]KAI5859517.1 hypothetical protein GGS23DRAFT_585769 [Durotheca rogersii]
MITRARLASRLASLGFCWLFSDDPSARARLGAPGVRDRLRCRDAMLLGQSHNLPFAPNTAHGATRATPALTTRRQSVAQPLIESDCITPPLSLLGPQPMRARSRVEEASFRSRRRRGARRPGSTAASAGKRKCGGSLKSRHKSEAGWFRRLSAGLRSWSAGGWIRVRWVINGSMELMLVCIPIRLTT